MPEEAKDVFANAEKVLEEGACKCGKGYMIIKVKGQDVPRILHKNPPCQQYSMLSMEAYLAWIKTKLDLKISEPRPNRAQQRRTQHEQHKHRASSRARRPQRQRRGKR